jgi:hypothetical protein
MPSSACAPYAAARRVACVACRRAAASCISQAAAAEAAAAACLVVRLHDHLVRVVFLLERIPASRLLQRTPGYSSVLQGTPAYSRVLQGTAAVWSVLGALTGRPQTAANRERPSAARSGCSLAPFERERRGAERHRVKHARRVLPRHSHTQGVVPQRDRAYRSRSSAARRSRPTAARGLARGRVCVCVRMRASTLNVSNKSLLKMM